MVDKCCWVNQVVLMLPLNLQKAAVEISLPCRIVLRLLRECPTSMRYAWACCFQGDRVLPLTIDAVSIKPAETVFGRFWVNWATAQLDESMKGTLKEIEVQASLDPSEESDWARNPNACGYRDRCALCSRMR